MASERAHTVQHSTHSWMIQHTVVRNCTHLWSAYVNECGRIATPLKPKFTIEIVWWLLQNFQLESLFKRFFFLKLKWKRWHRVHFPFICFVSLRLKISLIQLSVKFVSFLLLLVIFSNTILKYRWRKVVFLIQYLYHMKYTMVPFNDIQPLLMLYIQILFNVLISYVELHLYMVYTKVFVFGSWSY